MTKEKNYDKLFLTTKMTQKRDRIEQLHSTFLEKTKTEKGKLLAQLEAELNEFDELGAPIETALPRKILKANEQIELLQNQLSEPGRKYQEYKKALEDWESKKKEIYFQIHSLRRLSLFLNIFVCRLVRLVNWGFIMQTYKKGP